MGPVLIAIGILAGLMALFIITYSLNAKTPPPEGCQNPEDYSGCESCSDYSCLVKVRMETKEQHDRQ
ncbi:MAG: hypothetical protein WC251_00645 [Candidatus Izemoplasmatales bacterium]|jgi:hypothetical protein|nr:hypothetical protein [Candidatus Izemoplasmatales bacterium]